MRDITLEDTIYIDFTTRAVTGVPTQLAGSPVLSVLEENNATPITAGVSVSVDRASVTGLNMATIVATAANGYEAGKGYSVYISTGTVNSVSAVGEVVGQFTIQANPVNWAKVTAPTTAVDLSGTDIQLCDTVTTNTDMVAAAPTAAAIVNEWETQSQADPTGFHVNVMEVNSVAEDIATETKQDIIDTNIDQIETAVITNAAGVDIAADIIALKAETALIVADTNELQTDWADGGRLDLILDIIAADTTTDIPALIAALNDISSANVLTQVNAALDTAISELGVAAPTATPTLRTGLMLLYMALRNKTVVQTSGTDALEIYNDAGTKIASKLLTDDGSDYTEAEMS